MVAMAIETEAAAAAAAETLKHRGSVDSGRKIGSGGSDDGRRNRGGGGGGGDIGNGASRQQLPQLHFYACDVSSENKNFMFFFPPEKP